MKTALLKLLALPLFVAALMLPLAACKTGAPGTPPPAVSGLVNCSEANLWTNTTIANLTPVVEHAIEQPTEAGALSALVELATLYGEGEVACVVGYIGNVALHQKASSPNPLVLQRLNVTSKWLANEEAKGVRVTDYGGPVE